jgi:hypothetical protein
MITRRAIVMLVIGALIGAPSLADAQVRVPSRPRPTAPRDSLRRIGPRADSTSRRDSTGAPGDSTQKKDLVEWLPEDSVMTLLLGRQDATATRYQANEVVFQAQGRGIVLNGDAAVQRDQSIIVSDTILYSDSTKIVIALGDTAILRDPAQGPADVVALGRIAYDIQNRRGVITNVSTSVETGETWFLNANRSWFQGDSSATAEQRFYARNGTLTSCSDREHPDYYFKAKEIKLVQKRILVARPAVLYIEDVPVAWLPFIFQDLHTGRRSGILPPRIGVSDIVRNNPSYSRRVENIGYYWVLGDYADASSWIDWQSGARTGSGFSKLNAELNYRWLDRFMSGGLAVQRQSGGFGKSNNYHWNHNQDFSQQTHLNADVNYSSNASASRRTYTNPYQTLATIRSSANLTTAFGPAKVGLGYDRSQDLGGKISQTLPSLNVSTGTVSLAPWLSWTPSLTFSNALQAKIPSRELPIQFRFRPNGGDSTFTGSSRVTSAGLATPFTIHDYAISFNVRGRDLESNRPDSGLVIVNGDTSRRIFAKTFETGLDWDFSFGLPRFSQGKWNFAPSVSFVNATGGDFFLRNERTGGQFVNQGKRAQYSISASPTFFGLFPGFAGFSRFRHKVSPTITYSFAPAGHVSDEYLAAQGRLPGKDLGALLQNQINFGLSTNIEGKVRAKSDTASEESAEKLTIASVNFDGVGYNFQQLHELRRLGLSPKWTAGLTTSNWGYRLSSDLLPGASFAARYSLFQGDVRTDTARFKPYLENIEASFQLNRQSNIFAALARVFGRPIKNENPELDRAQPTRDDIYAQQVAAQPIAGSSSRRSQYSMPDTHRGWSASFTFSHTHPRPVPGQTVVDPISICRDVPAVTRLQCEDIARAAQSDSVVGSSASRSNTVAPPRTNLNASTSFSITQKWAAQWSTDYDFQANRFGSQIVSLRRELHDWDAVFGFTKGPTGSFAFTAFISLRAQPDLKFDYRKSEYR